MQQVARQLGRERRPLATSMRKYPGAREFDAMRVARWLPTFQRSERHQGQPYYRVGRVMSTATQDWWLARAFLVFENTCVQNASATTRFTVRMLSGLNVSRGTPCFSMSRCGMS